MRIATLNIWNNDTLFEERIFSICEAVSHINADVLCLQEVRNEQNRSIAGIIAERTGCPYFVFREYPDCPDEGLAIISRFPFFDTKAIWDTDTEISNYCALRVNLNCNGTNIGITNVHLNWRGEGIRIEQLKAVDKWIKREDDFEKFEVLCGDFNDIPNSNAHDFLKGHGWQDAVELICGKEESNYATFDLLNNLYLKEDIRPKEGLRFDWIMMSNLNEGEHVPEAVDIFGNNCSADAVIPSDHYGLYIDMERRKMDVYRYHT